MWRADSFHPPTIHYFSGSQMRAWELALSHTDLSKHLLLASPPLFTLRMKPAWAEYPILCQNQLRHRWARWPLAPFYCHPEGDTNDSSQERHICELKVRIHRHLSVARNHCLANASQHWSLKRSWYRLALAADTDPLSGAFQHSRFRR